MMETERFGAILRGTVREAGYLVKAIGKTILFFYLPVMSVLTVLHFPYDTDPSVNPRQASRLAPVKGRSAGFYEAVYRADRDQKRGMDYEATARAAAEESGIETSVRQFVEEYRLHNKRILEVGSGRGYLQDVVKDYTGLDLSPSVARYYHKPFVVGSATGMPFADNSYDAAWSVWVLEHIPEPERALLEIRRVLKDGSLLFLWVSWDCPTWASDGFQVRPYSDFNWKGKLVKASVPVRSSDIFQLLYRLPTRTIRWVHYGIAGERERLRFRALDPNYQIYWQPDSDAAISLDSFETYLWFRARGDDCLSCQEAAREWQKVRNPLVIRIRKP